MLYSYLKILHILSATGLVTSMGYSVMLWRRMKTARQTNFYAGLIQSQTGFVIIPCLILQLATGFSMISLQHEDLSQLWIGGSVVGAIVVIGSWFTFMYFLLLQQQLPTHAERRERYLTVKQHYLRRIQFFMLSLCGAALLCMIFLMANKVS